MKVRTLLITAGIAASVVIATPASADTGQCVATAMLFEDGSYSATAIYDRHGALIAPEWAVAPASLQDEVLPVEHAQADGSVVYVNTFHTAWPINVDGQPCIAQLDN